MCKTKNGVNRVASASSLNATPNKAAWRSSFVPGKSALPSIAEIKASIPAECFERSALHSFYFVIRDTLLAALCVLAAYYFLPTSLPSSGLLSLAGLKWFLGWNLYAFWMGAVCTGHWVLAHECGHNAFSTSRLLNDAVGFVLHQLLLVPYFAWQYSHKKHHRRTNHLVDGETHIPSTGAENGISADPSEPHTLVAAIHEVLGDGLFGVFQVFTHLAIGWPLYLLGFAQTGRLAYGGAPLTGFADHFRPGSEMFPETLRPAIALSTLGVVAGLALLGKLSLTYGPLPVFLYYFGPYLWVNCWLVLYTWLQHTDPTVPHYGESDWTWVAGALSTIDRPYYIFDYLHHDIGSSHVVHHLFHEMPFYRARVATVAAKKFLGPLYNYDPTPFPIAMWKIAMTCHYVESLEGTQYYKSFNDLPKSSVKSGKTKSKKA